MNKTQKDCGFPIDTTFDVALADSLARLETYNKHYYRPNTYLHKWWARRCGTTFRLILKHLVTDSTKQDYYSPGGLEGQIILDPMMGGGTTLHEALRLGANVAGIDLDPIPALQARATLSTTSLAELNEAYRLFIRTMRSELTGLFLTKCPTCKTAAENWFVLYGARRRCACRQVLVVDSYLLRQETSGLEIRLCPHCRSLTTNAEPCPCSGEDEVTIFERGTSTCPHCQKPFQEDFDQPYYLRYEPIAVTGHCKQHHFFIRSPDDKTLQAIIQANKRRPDLPFDPQNFAIEPGPKSNNLRRRGIYSYLDLYSSRQLQIMERAIHHLPQDQSLRLNLALLLSTSLEFNSLLCGYKGKSPRRSGAIRHAFARHAYSIPYTALENNPLYSRKASGTWQKLFHSRIVRGRKWALQPRERDLRKKKSTFIDIKGEQDQGHEVSNFTELQRGSRHFLLQQGSATTLDLPDESIDAIVTDPPYFDSVQYSDLSAYFRVWLQQMLPDQARWAFDEADSAVVTHIGDPPSHYAELMEQIFVECHRVLRKPAGRLIFTFHHWKPQAWSALTTSLKYAGFTLLNCAVVHSENPISVHVANMNALIHDAILVLAPGPSAAPKKWENVQKIDTDSSAHFCSSCAQLLGWMLDSDLLPEEIDTAWQQVIN